MSESSPHHRLRHLTTRERTGDEITCDRMADIINLASSDLYQRILAFAFEEMPGDNSRYSLLEVARCIDDFCSPDNFEFMTNFDKKVAQFPQQRIQLLGDVRKLEQGISGITNALKHDYRQLTLDDTDVTLMTIGAAHPDYPESLLKRRQMAAQMFFEQMENMTISLERRLCGEFDPGERIYVGGPPAQETLPHKTSVALTGLYAVLLGGFHEDIVQHYAELEGPPKAKEFGASLGIILQAIAEYERSDHTELSHVDKKVADEFPTVARTLERVIADLEPKIKAQDEQADVQQLDLYNAAQSLKASFEAYRNERPLARREADLQ